MCMDGIVTSPADTVSPHLRVQRERLRGAADELVGQVFFGQMLKMARNSPLKGEIGHGGRGEEIFGAQLDMELAKRVGKASGNEISDAIYEQYARFIEQV